MLEWIETKRHTEAKRVKAVVSWKAVGTRKPSKQEANDSSAPVHKDRPKYPRKTYLPSSHAGAVLPGNHNGLSASAFTTVDLSGATATGLT